jgi:hypothetical protein
LDIYKGKVSNLIHHYADYDLSLRRRISGEIVQWIPGGRHQLVDFGVERHILVTEKITQDFHHSSVVVTQSSASRAHSSRVRAQLLRRFRDRLVPSRENYEISLRPI